MSLTQWENKEFGLFKLPFGVKLGFKNKFELNRGKCKLKEQVQYTKGLKSEKDVKLSEIIRSFIDSPRQKNKGGLIFVDTCRIIWTQLKGYEVILTSSFY